MANRWWTYQHERFPIFGHGFLITAVCFGAIVYSLRARSHFEFPDGYTLLRGKGCYGGVWSHL